MRCVPRDVVVGSPIAKPTLQRRSLRRPAESIRHYGTVLSANQQEYDPELFDSAPFRELDLGDQVDPP